MQSCVLALPHTYLQFLPVAVSWRCCVCALQGSKSFFSEIIASISDISFSRDGRYILSRDYMNLKLWDLAMEARPVVTLAVHEELRPRVSSHETAWILCNNLHRGKHLQSWYIT
jgi:hypothetical protein